jgi:hypothetical protein
MFLSAATAPGHGLGGLSELGEKRKKKKKERREVILGKIIKVFFSPAPLGCAGLNKCCSLKVLLFSILAFCQH